MDRTRILANLRRAPRPLGGVLAACGFPKSPKLKWCVTTHSGSARPGSGSALRRQRYNGLLLSEEPEGAPPLFGPSPRALNCLCSVGGTRPSSNNSSFSTRPVHPSSDLCRATLAPLLLFLQLSSLATLQPNRVAMSFVASSNVVVFCLRVSSSPSL